MSLEERNRLRLLREIREESDLFDEEIHQGNREIKTERAERFDIQRHRKIERAYNEIADCLNILRYYDEIRDDTVIDGRMRKVRINPLTEMFVNVHPQE